MYKLSIVLIGGAVTLLALSLAALHQNSTLFTNNFFAIAVLIAVCIAAGTTLFYFDFVRDSKRIEKTFEKLEL
jgi:hypothetical protein